MLKAFLNSPYRCLASSLGFDCHEGFPSRIWAKVSSAIGKARIDLRTTSSCCSFSTLRWRRSENPDRWLRVEAMIILYVVEETSVWIAVWDKEEEEEEEKGGVRHAVGTRLGVLNMVRWLATVFWPVTCVSSSAFTQPTHLSDGLLWIVFITAGGLETSGRRHPGRLSLMHPCFEEANKWSGLSHLWYIQNPRMPYTGLCGSEYLPWVVCCFTLSLYRTAASLSQSTGHQTPGCIRDLLDNSLTGGYLHIISTCRSSWRHSALPASPAVSDPAILSIATIWHLFPTLSSRKSQKPLSDRKAETDLGSKILCGLKRPVGISTVQEIRHMICAWTASFHQIFYISQTRLPVHPQWYWNLDPALLVGLGPLDYVFGCFCTLAFSSLRC